MTLLSHAGMSHQRPEFGIERGDGRRARRSPSTEEVVAAHPFCNLMHFRKDRRQGER